MSIRLAAAASCLRLRYQVTEYAANPSIAMVTYMKLMKKECQNFLTSYLKYPQLLCIFCWKATVDDNNR